MKSFYSNFGNNFILNGLKSTDLSYFSYLKYYSFFIFCHLFGLTLEIFKKKFFSIKTDYVIGYNADIKIFKEYQIEITANFETLVIVFWVLTAIFIVVFSSLFIIRSRINKFSNLDKFIKTFKNFTIFIFLVSYSLLATYLYITFLNLNNLEFFGHWFFSSQSFFNLKFIILYFFTLFYPLIIFLGFENQKLFELLKNNKKFFIFYLFTFTFYTFFTFALFSNSFLTFFISVEGQSFTFVTLIAFIRNRINYSLLLSYILQLVICSGFILLGITIFYINFNSLNFDVISILTRSGTIPVSQEVTLFIGLFCFMFGVAGKAGAFPFFRWPFDLYSSLPMPLVFISSTVGKVGVLIPTFFMLKTCFETQLIIINPFIIIMLVFATVGLLFSSTFALGIKNLRELIAASGVIQTSYIFFLILNPNYFGGIIFMVYIMGYVFALIVLCIFVILVEFNKNDENTKNNQSEHVSSYSKLTDFINNLAIWTTFLIVSGFPPISFFFSKFAFLANIYISKFAFSNELSNILFIIFIIANFLNIIVYIKFIFNNINKPNNQIFLPKKDSIFFWIAVIFTTAIILIIAAWIFTLNQ